MPPPVPLSQLHTETGVRFGGTCFSLLFTFGYLKIKREAARCCKGVIQD